MVNTISSTAPLRVLVLSLGATCARALQACLAGRGAVVSSWSRLPPNRDEWSLLSSVDVVLLVYQGDVDTEFVTIERIRDAAPLVELVCVCESVEVETAVESLRAGVFAVVPDNVNEDHLVEVLSAACSRRRRAEVRMRALNRSARACEYSEDQEHGRAPSPRAVNAGTEPGLGHERPILSGPGGTNRPTRPDD